MELSARGKNFRPKLRVNSLLLQCTQTCSCSQNATAICQCPDCPRLVALSALRVYMPAHGQPSSCLCHQIERTSYAACARI